MKLIKNLSVAAAIASIAASASAAVIQFTWTGAAAKVVTGTINFPSFAGIGTYNDSGASLLSFNINGTPLTSIPSNFDFSFNFTTATAGSLSVGSPFDLSERAQIMDLWARKVPLELRHCVMTATSSTPMALPISP